MNNSMKFLLDKNNSGERLDVFLSEKYDHLTRSNIKKIIEMGNVKINKKSSNSPRQKLKLMIKIDINLKKNQKNCT